MAIQAGRVGVDPSQVTLSGKIKGGGVSPEVLTKEEAARIYQTILGMAEYLKKTDANTLYQKISDMVNYQLKLVSGQNIKRINGEDLLGSGNISVLTTQLADGIYQKITDMADYVLKSELPDMTDLLTKTEAPGYGDILTRAVGLPLINNKLNIDGTSISYKTNAYDFNNFISGIAYGDTTCLSMPSSDKEYLIVGSGDSNNRIQIATDCAVPTPTMYVRKKYIVSGSITTWSGWQAFPNAGDLMLKQDILLQGTGINISNNTISNKFTNLASGSNLNDVKYNYRGYVYQAVNRPTGASNFGMILAGFNENGTRGQQIYVDIYEGKNFLYSRVFYDTTLWSEWRRIGDCYEVGDSYTKNYVVKVCAGFIGAGGSNLVFSIPMDKPIRASNFTFTSLTITLYVNGNRLINNANIIGNSDYTVSVLIPTDKTCITVTITPTTPFSVGFWTCAVSVAAANGTFS